MVVRENASRSVKSGLVPLSDPPGGTCEVPALPLAYVSCPEGGVLSRDVGRGFTRIYGSTYVLINTIVLLEN